MIIIMCDFNKGGLELQLQGDLQFVIIDKLSFYSNVMSHRTFYAMAEKKLEK